jgi:hypothetical protein
MARKAKKVAGNFPLLQSKPLSGKEESAHDAAALEAQMSLAWRDALEWAKKGDREHLLKMLRTESQLNERDVLDYLAEILEKAKRSRRGHPPTRPQRTWAIVADDLPVFVDERDLPLLEKKKWLEENKHLYSSLKALNKAASERFNVVEPTIENAKRRSRNAMAKSRST